MSISVPSSTNRKIFDFMMRRVHLNTPPAALVRWIITSPALRSIRSGITRPSRRYRVICSPPALGVYIPAFVELTVATTRYALGLTTGSELPVDSPEYHVAFYKLVQAMLDSKGERT